MNFHIFIPARGGSKRFPGKNLHSLANLPLISHSIIYALKSFPPDKIWVNSDDDNILDEAIKYQVRHIKRPIEFAEDETPTSAVSAFQVKEMEKMGIACDALILLQPTNPLRPPGLIEESINAFLSSKRESLATFSKFHKKVGTILNNEFTPTNYIPGQRMQDKNPEYFENGLLYITKVEVLKKKIIITDDVFPFIINDVFCDVDIDEPKDILYAEFLINNF